MRVLMLSKACGVGAYQKKLEELAALEGVELMVIIPPYWQEESRRIPLERLHTRGYRLEVEPIRFNGHFHFFYFPGLGRHLKSFRPDIVHVDEEPYNLASWHAMRLSNRIKARTLFFTWQNLYRRYPPPFRWMEQYCFSKADRAIAGNAEAVQVLRRKGFAKPVDVIPQFGVDPEIFRPEDSDQLSAFSRQPFRIGYVGRLVEQKGIMDLLEALAGMRGEFKLTMVGAGPLQATVEAKAAELGIAEKVEIIPGVPSQQMPGLYNRMDALVLPSRTRSNWKEQFGRALVEAMACRVPVIGSDSGEIPNVIGDAGLVFPEGDVESLRQHLEKLRESPELRRELGEQGRARVMEHYTQAQIARLTYRVYQKISSSDR
ncbi:MAG: glycosyltransferase [Chloroflexota bacterium]|jgi:glycosyltransferase involved in cell wall biosynthesis